MRRRVAWSFVALLTVVTGCRSIFGIDDDAPLRDEPTSDGSTEDAQIEGDGGAEAHTPTFCDSVTPKPTFCADFDEGDVLKGWSNANRTPDIGQSGGGTIVADEAMFARPSRSANLRIPAIAASGQSSSAFLKVAVDNISAAGVMITFDLRIDTELFPDGKGTISVLEILVESPETETVTLLRNGRGFYLASKTDLVKVDAPFPLGSSKTVELTLSRGSAATGDGGDAGGGTAQLRFDVQNVAKVALAPAPATPFNASFVLGPVTVGPIGAFGMHVDNVRIYGRTDL